MENKTLFQTKILPEIQQTDYITGSDLLAHLDELLRTTKYSSFLLLSDTNIFKIYGKKVVSSLEELKKPVIISLIKPGEAHKVLSEVSTAVAPYFKAGFDRRACLVALGGGVITDFGGFIASILMRGIGTIYLPTTLLAQVDAAIGGKTGVDSQLGNDLMIKNMIGTFQQPAIVISDVDTLRTLPKKEILNGLGEMAKYWVGWGRPTLEQMNAVKTPRGWQGLKDTPGVALDDSPGVEELAKTISLCQRIKIDIIQKDPFETKGIRQKLNLGHTIGHAIEGALSGKLSHGQSVAVGLLAAARISAEKKMLDEEILKMILDTLTSLGLPIKIRASQYSTTRLNLVSDVYKALKLDKKAGRFVLIKDIGNLLTGINVEDELINQVLKEVIL